MVICVVLKGYDVAVNLKLGYQSHLCGKERGLAFSLKSLALTLQWGRAS